jgi:hypothetical protein
VCLPEPFLNQSLVHRNKYRSALLKQRVVPGILEHRDDADVVINRVRVGDGTGERCTDNGVAGYRAIANRGAYYEAAGMLPGKLRSRQSCSGQRLEHGPGGCRRLHLGPEGRSVKPESCNKHNHRDPSAGPLHVPIPMEKQCPERQKAGGAARSSEPLAQSGARDRLAEATQAAAVTTYG